jgi:hypothetical protein
VTPDIVGRLVASEEPPSATPAAESQYVAAAETIRQAARWLVAAFAGVGGVLVAGVPLTDVGRVEAGTSDFWFAVMGIAAALVAIAYMIHAVSRVFTSEFISFAEYSEATVPGVTGAEKRRKLLLDIGEVAERSGDELYGAEARDLGELHTRLQDTNQAVRTAKLEGQAAPEDAVRHARDATAAANRAMEFINYEFVRRTFRHLFPRLAAGGLIVALGVGTYVFQTAQSPPKDQAVNRPTAVRLYLKPDSDELKQLGKACQANGLPAVAVAGSFSEPEVVTDSSGGGCMPTRLTITQDAGVAVPVVKP